MLQTICLCNIFETRLAHFLTEINDNIFKNSFKRYTNRNNSWFENYPRVD